jgi:hypothetical protein
MSLAKPGRVPSPEAVWMVAEVLGFRNSIAHCRSWREDLRNGGVAINIVQPLAHNPELASLPMQRTG